MFKYKKVEIGKCFFAGGDIKNVEPKARLFYVKPCKNCFLIETFLYENKILRTNNFFFVETALF